MTTPQKVTRPSSPREFFARLYGHLENTKEEIPTKTEQNQISTPRQSSNVVTPMPILATPLPFLLPSGNEAHLTAAAAAGLTAFRKELQLIRNNFYVSPRTYLI